MKTAAIIVAILGLGGVTAYMVTAEDDSNDATEAADDSDGKRSGRRKGAAAGRRGGGSDRALEARVEKLEQEVKALRAAMKVRTGIASASGGGSDVLDELSGEGGTGLIQAEVRSALEEEREEERERRDEMRRQRMEMMTADALAAMGEVAEFPEATQTQLSEMWAAEMEQMGQFRQKVRDGELTFADVREQARQIRADTDAAAKEILSEEQYAAYEENRPGWGRGGRGGGRGGPPRGG